MDGLRDALARLGGNPNTTPVEHRIYRMSSLVGAVLALGVQIPSNLLLIDISPWVNVPLATFGAGALWLYARSRRDKFHPNLLMASVLVLFSAAWFTNGGLKGSVPVYFPAAFMFLAVYSAPRARYLGAAVLMTLGVVLVAVERRFPALVTPYPTEADRLVDIVMGMLISMFVCLMILSSVFDAYLRERDRLLAVNEHLTRSLAEIRTLQGLLPICAWCHKVRDDQGLWTRVENYLAAHSEARFTHAICPDCERRHFPENATGLPSQHANQESKPEQA